MGQRANLVVVEGSGYSLSYCHWCASTLTTDLFWGPRHALAFIDRQRLVEDGEWLDTVWAEGGAVFDERRRELLLYGGEDLRYDVPLRRLYLQLLRIVWEGWDVRWAHRGIVDMAERVGVPAARVIAAGRGGDGVATSLRPPEDRTWADHVGSARLADGSLWLFPLQDAGLGHYLAAGPALLEMAARDGELRELDTGAWGSAFPTAGFHLDEAARALTFWSAREFAEADELRALWPGWDLRHAGDRFEEQLALCEGRLRMPAEGDEEQLAGLRGILLHEPGGESPADMVRRTVEERRAAGHDVQVNPSAYQYAPQELSRAVREEILEYAVGMWRLGRG